MRVDISIPSPNVMSGNEKDCKVVFPGIVISREMLLFIFFHYFMVKFVCLIRAIHNTYTHIKLKSARI